MESGIYLLPVEVLLAIFAPLRKQDLAAIRLTSKYLNDVASQIYLDSITISLRRQTLVDLDTIIRHPGLKKGVRRVIFDISQYDDSATKKEVYAQRLVLKLEKELEDHLYYACNHHNSKSLIRVFRKYTCKKGVLCNPERIHDLQDWIKLCEGFPTQSARNRLWPNRRAASISSGYERYCELAKDQKLLSQSQAHVRLLERALKSMPLVKSLRIVDLGNIILRSSITLDNRNGHNSFCLDRSLVADPQYMAAFRLDRILQAWEKQGLRLEEFNCREAGALLQMLSTGLNQPLSPATTSVLKHVVTLKLKMGYDKDDSPDQPPDDHHDGAIERLPSGDLYLMLSQAEALQSLTIDGGASIMRPHFPLDNNLAPATWKKIKHIALKRLTIKFRDFMPFCILQQTTLVSLEFEGVDMLGGTWRYALEIFRTALRLEKVRFYGIHDQYERPLGFTDAEEEVMARYVLNPEEDLIGLLY